MQRWERVAEWCGYRHGRKSRRLTLRTGTVDLAVPRGRLVTHDGGEREWLSQLAQRYWRSSAEVEQSVLSVYLSGSNTRNLQRLTHSDPLMLSLMGIDTAFDELGQKRPGESVSRNNLS
jgi:transposase-like protein